VIRQNVYRWKEVGGAGRFEQVGMSWVKHGFGALQDSFCCQCQAGGDWSHLGVGCSDPYDAGTNGLQSLLGPNWQINAHTGFYTYPPRTPRTARTRSTAAARSRPRTSSRRPGARRGTSARGTTSRRTTRSPGNQDNNASWRPLSVSGGPTDFNFSLTGSTHQGEPAIRAWPTVEAGVNLVDLPVPGDGLVILGSKATDLGGGQWHYQYAVYNMNADRNVGTFSVPVPAGVTVTSAKFDGVAHHDGDGPGDVDYSSLEWSPSLAGGALTWTTETEAQNASANAIRWGTLYSFRFDANAPPVSGPITLGLWKAGSPPSMVGTGDVPGGNGTSIESFCFGDGTAGACPCANSGTPGHGCENSDTTGGALLTAMGTPSLAADTLALTSAGERSSSLSIFLQGDLESAPLAFGDGLRCADGNLKRLYTRNASGGSVTAPIGAEPSVSARSAALGDTIPALGTRLYQTYYRDPSASFCPAPPGSTFNASNGLRILWGP
jgi:hypothetical protein